MIIIPIKWLFHWEYTQHFQTNPHRQPWLVYHPPCVPERKRRGKEDCSPCLVDGDHHDAWCWMVKYCLYCFPFDGWWVYHGISWYIMVYHGISWLMVRNMWYIMIDDTIYDLYAPAYHLMLMVSTSSHLPSSKVSPTTHDLSDRGSRGDVCNDLASAWQIPYSEVKYASRIFKNSMSKKNMHPNKAFGCFVLFAIVPFFRKNKKELPFKASQKLTCSSCHLAILPPWKSLLHGSNLSEIQ